jgi:hypothetical protein
MNSPLVILLLVGQGLGQAPVAPAEGSPDNKAEAAEARAVAKLLATEYVVELDKSSGVKLQQTSEPVLRWLLQLDRRFYSDVFVWTHEGRPEVVAAITSVYGPRRIMETEIHSLSSGLPRMLHSGQVVWQPERPGLEWKPIPGAPKPGASAATRLTQMRGLAAEYSVTGVYANMQEELRLMPAPIYRYKCEKQDVTDGALFAFARGTDPDTFLLIEARKTADGAQWQYALARFCGHCSLQATRSGTEIWQADVLSTATVTDPKQPYCGLRKYSDFPVVK